MVLLSPSLSFVLLVKIRFLQNQINFLSLDKKGKIDSHFHVNADLVYVRLSCSKVEVLTAGTNTDTGLRTHINTDTAYQYR